MSVEIVCIPVTPDQGVAHGWGKAPAVALAQVVDGSIVDWSTKDVRWDELHDAGPEGAHHARIVRFLQDNAVGVVVAEHMGEPMQNTLAKLGVRVVLGAHGDARTAVIEAAS
jgi:predicted Fe-Mo cluster-binding NifX family protein